MKLRELITLGCVCAVLLGMTAKALQIGTEEARKAQCVQNMAKQAAGVIAYNDAVGYLPPLATVNNHPGWNLQILPYIEHQAVHNVLLKNRLYDKDYQGILLRGVIPVNPYDIGDTNIAGSRSTFSGAHRDWYRFTTATSGTIIDAFTQNDGDGIVWEDVNNALAGVSEYRCPTRQPSQRIKKITADKVYSNSLTTARFNNNLYEQSCMRGAVGDYAAGIWYKGASVQETFFSVYASGEDGEFIKTKSYNAGNSSFRWMFGEKYIPQFAIEGDTPIANMWNGGVHRTYIEPNNRIPALNSSFRAVGESNTPIAVTGDEVESEVDFLTGNGIIRFPETFETGDYLWGSTHPSIFNMARGDGSVQTVNAAISPLIFNNGWRVIGAVDGNVTPL